MAKTLDFNKLRQPTLPLVMCDKDKTTITVTSPSEGLVEELQVIMPELDGVFKSGDQKAIDAIYDMVAKFISCNLEELEVTADDLRRKYWPEERILNQLYLLKFCAVYLDFIREIGNAKN